jgi:hypothetical protein
VEAVRVRRRQRRERDFDLAAQAQASRPMTSTVTPAWRPKIPATTGAAAMTCSKLSISSGILRPSIARCTGSSGPPASSADAGENRERYAVRKFSRHF